MIDKLLAGRKIILGSQSPRRSQLLAELQVTFEKRVIETNEDFDESLDVYKVAEEIAKDKATAHRASIANNEIVITADCVVIENGEILGKPKDREEAVSYIKRMSDNTHDVVSGVCIMDADRLVSFSETATVRMKPLSVEEIEYYIDNFNPYDKAGAYGIQEWIGHSKIEWIKGTYTCIMGLPTRMLYEKLTDFLK